MRDITRRSAVSALVGTAGLSLVSVGASAIVSDPIFAAIERHKALNAAFTEVLRGMSDFEERHDDAAAGIDEWERREEDASNAERDACDEMVATEPTTLAGLLALLRYVEDEHDRGEKILDESGLEELVSVTVTALAAVVDKPAGEVVS
jgi:hypothetical protein